MTREQREPSAAMTVSFGLLGLAAAMGIGRFSLTPIFPLMQQDLHTTLAQGSWLASANYLGYLAGAIICMVAPPRPVSAIRFGLVGVGVFTLAMGLTQAPLAWAAWRLCAGVASAFVLVGVSAWAMPILTRRGKPQWSGYLFSGVGVGIAFAGLFGLTAGIETWGSRAAWLVLGVVAAALAVLLWRPLIADARSVGPSERAVQDNGRRALPQGALITAACYAAFGYGYIIPATFLPAVARDFINDPAVFGWVWPVFGAAAAISTMIVGRFGTRLAPQRLWIAAQWVLASGVIAPALAVNRITLVIAAVGVGGSFMVITMAGIREALRIGGDRPSRMIGMMTTGFAIGQIAGPITVAMFAGSDTALTSVSLLATVALIISNCVLTAGYGAGSSATALALRPSSTATSR